MTFTKGDSYHSPSKIHGAPGTRLFTDELAAALCVRHHGESCKDVGMALRERVDVRNVRNGVWEKI